MINRINEDRQDAEEDEVTLAAVAKHLKDWRLYIWAFNLMASTLPGYAYSYFLPIILREGMGFSTAHSQLLTAPPYALAAIIACFSGWLGDKYKIRGPIIAVHQLLTAVGTLVTVYGRSNAARYFGAYLGKASSLFVEIFQPVTNICKRHRVCAILRPRSPHISSQQHHSAFEASSRHCNLHYRWRSRRHYC